MFTELKKLIAKRSLTITVAVLDNEQIRVNVVPHARPDDNKVNEQIKYSNKSEVESVPEEAIKALTTPISITGTGEEIDAKFPAILSQYVESHVQLQETLDRASSEIAEAVKAIDERNQCGSGQALKQGVALTDVYNTIQAYMGGLFINHYNNFGRTWLYESWSLPFSVLLSTPVAVFGALQCFGCGALYSVSLCRPTCFKWRTMSTRRSGW